MQEAELIEVNPDYAHIKLPDGRKTSGSTRHLAPKKDTFIDAYYQEALEENQQSADSFNQNESLVTEAYKPLLETPRKSTGESTQEESSLLNSKSSDYFRTTTDGTLHISLIACIQTNFRSSSHTIPYSPLRSSSTTSPVAQR